MLLSHITSTITQLNSLFVSFFQFNNNLAVMIKWRTKVEIFLMNTLLNVYMYALKKKSQPPHPSDSRMYTPFTEKLRDRQRMPTKISKCFRLEDMLNFNVLENF